ncbi:MAG: RNA-binding protein [Campylobacteraceae bacterium]|nr:RNA-binding protein [Campylobacteraceae bacterium]
MNIYVGNLSYKMTESELEAIFGQFGAVLSAKIVTDRETNRSKGFAFVEMSDDAAAQEAIEQLNNKEVGGRNLRVNEAKPREERPKRTARY